jgi:hypothetical protein
VSPLLHNSVCSRSRLELFAAAAVHRRWMQPRASSDDDDDDSSVWGAVLISFLRTFFAAVLVTGWEGRTMDGRQ